MKLKSLLAVSLLALPLPVMAQEVVDLQAFGNCVAGTFVDPMTDETGAYFVCGVKPTVVFIGREPGNSSLQIALLTETTQAVADALTLQEITETAGIEVKFRVDKGVVRPGSGFLARDGFVYLMNDSLAKAVAQDMANGQRLHFSIGTTGTETIEVNGAKEAIEDMRRRLGLE